MPDLPVPAPDCASCAARDEQIAALEAELREQADETAELRARVARLERALSRNSGNSSMPPSGDDAPGRKPPRKERRAAQREAEKKRKRGKQPGAPGSAMSWAEPDDTRDHFPAGTCPCGADLAGAADLGVARSYQQLEIPQPSAQRVQHDLHLGVCGCGREHLAARPPGVPDTPLSIGPDLRALAVYLVVFQHVPVERCQVLLADVAGAPVSSGFIHSCLRKAAALAADMVRLIRTLITAARWPGSMRPRCGPGRPGRRSTCWARSPSSTRCSSWAPGPWNRSATSGSCRASPGWSSRTGTSITSMLAGGTSPGIRRVFPTCSGTIRTLPRATRRYLAGAGAAGAARTDPRLARRPHAGLAAIPAGTAGPLILEFRRAVRAGLASVPRIPGPKASTAQHPGRDPLEFCSEHGREDAVLRFTRDTTIWPTNNLSERGVRPLKTQQKISGRLTSEDATQDRLDIRSYIDTARKHGQDTLIVLRGLFTGTPWRPQPQPRYRRNLA